jgi:hypothetical protein
MSLDSKLLLLSENSTDRRLRIEWKIVSQVYLILENGTYTGVVLKDIGSSIREKGNLSYN